VFIRDAIRGTSVSTIGTGVGDATTPSGLAKISDYGNDPMHDATSVATYGGDLLGNVWRFDINAGTAIKFATLKDSSGAAQPITSLPELGTAYSKRIVFIGTGKYLENIDLTSTQQETFYAITDDGTNTTLAAPRSVLKQQVLTLSAGGSTRTGSQNPVDLRTDRGWYVDFPDSGERVNVDPKLDAGLLVVATTVPSNTVCSPGGYSWLNYFNYLTGTIDNGITSVKTNAPIVGINIFYTPDGVRRINIVTSDNPTPTVPPGAPPPSSNLFNFQGKRVIWRELIP
jgi:type IV pilus assembly protein PilY1